MAHECYNRIIWLLRMDFDGFKIKSSSTLAVSIYGCPYGMVMYVASLVAGKCNTLVSSCPFSRLGGSRNVPHVTRDRVVGVAPAV